MNKIFWLVFGAMLSTSLMAQQVTNPPPAGALDAVVAPATNPAVPPAEVAPTNTAPEQPKKAEAAKKKDTAKKSAKKAAKKTAKPVLHSTPLVPGPAIVIASNVNVRGQAKLRSEVVTKVTKDQLVNVLEEIVRNDSADDEPSAWARIELPAGTPVWVNSAFLSNNVVSATRLNLRGGAGENYSVLGRIERGTEVKPITTKEGWTQIETPASAYGFVAAQYLKQDKSIELASKSSTPSATETAGTNAPATTTVPEMPTTQETVSDTPAVAAAPTDVPAVTSSTNQPAAVIEDAPAVAATDTNMVPEEVIEEPPPKRIVQREGIVRGTVSIQAPSHFALVSPENGKLINYLYNTSPSLDLRRYKGLRVIVVGEEALEERWGVTPVITIEKIEVLDE